MSRVADADADDLAREKLDVPHALEGRDPGKDRQARGLQPRQLGVERVEVEHGRRHDELRAGVRSCARAGAIRCPRWARRD